MCMSIYAYLHHVHNTPAVIFVYMNLASSFHRAIVILGLYVQCTHSSIVHNVAVYVTYTFPFQSSFVSMNLQSEE